MTSKPPDHSGRFRLFIILGSVFLGMTGLFWSLDQFFVYISAGISLAFFFLALLFRPAPPVVRQYQRSHHPGTGPSSTPKSTSANTASPAKALMMLGASIGFMILFFLIVDMLSSADADYNENYSLGESFRYKGRYDSARFFYRKAFEQDETAESYLGYGNTMLDERNYDSAFIYYDKALSVDPDYTYALYNKGIVRYNQKRYNEAILFGRQAIDVEPTYTEGHILIADSYYAKVSYDSAFQWYASARENGANSAWVSHVLGYLYQSRGEINKAVELYNESLYYDSSNAEVYTRLAELVPEDQRALYRRLAQQYSQGN